MATKTSKAAEVEEQEAPPEVGLRTTNPNYSYGLPVTVSGNPANGGAPVVVSPAGVVVSIAGGANMVPPANTGTVSTPGGSPNDELVTMYTPVLSSISPTTVVHGVANAVVTCTGTGFVAATPTRSGTTARVAGVDQVTTFVSATSVTYVGQHLTAPAGTVQVTVQNVGLESVQKPFIYT
jgi:hypothetical protein